MKTSLLDSSTWKVIKEQAQVMLRSNYFTNVKTLDQAIVIALKGYELGIAITTSFSHINIIQGKPTVSAELMLSLIYQHCPGSVINFIKIEDECCVIEACRPGGKTHTFKYDVQDAKSAGLLSRPQWKQYPRAMFRSRCVSEMARTLFPDVIMGCSYTPEEIAPEGMKYLEDGTALSVPEHITEVPSVGKQDKPVVALVKERKTFDKSNSKHVDKLNEMLEKKGVATTNWATIHERMHGKPSVELESVIKTFYEEMFEVDTDEIPFDPDINPIKSDSDKSDQDTKELSKSKELKDVQ